MQLATDLTFEIALAQECIERLQNMVRMTETLQSGMENQCESWQYVRHVQYWTGTCASKFQVTHIPQCDKILQIRN